PIFGEEEFTAVRQVLESGMLVHGKQTVAFEAAFADFSDAPQAVSVSSCTAGMHLCYIAWGIGAGDEVIVPAQTHVATAHAVALTGARPVFVDADTATGNIDIDAVAAKITDRTRAIAVVHFLGLPVDMARINQIAAAHGLKVLEDCALAPGARVGDTHVGLLGDAGSYSFYPVKHFTTAEGGIVTTRDTSLADRLRKLRAFGVDRHVGERVIPGMYDVVELGYNYRMNEIEAAIGVEQLRRLPGMLEQRKRNHTRLTDALINVDGLSLLQSSGNDLLSSHYCHCIILDRVIADRRLDVINRLRSRGVGTSIYYPQPVPRLTWYRTKYGYDENAFPAATRISDQSIALPVGPHLGEEDVDYIVKIVGEAMTEVCSTMTGVSSD
ncbi:MAG: DegT/DnrJ/EryC1/StrS family aminotransferase, partial [Lentisphaeria bacterium]|nr:DegT/DnrJ/EryC1/StrS family aminotransferase [Lentisphaeria bacterium]